MLDDEEEGNPIHVEGAEALTPDNHVATSSSRVDEVQLPCALPILPMRWRHDILWLRF